MEEDVEAEEEQDDHFEEDQNIGCQLRFFALLYNTIFSLALLISVNNVLN